MTMNEMIETEGEDVDGEVTTIIITTIIITGGIMETVNHMQITTTMNQTIKKVGLKRNPYTENSKKRKITKAREMSMSIPAEGTVKVEGIIEDVEIIGVGVGVDIIIMTEAIRITITTIMVGIEKLRSSQKYKSSK